VTDSRTAPRKRSAETVLEFTLGESLIHLMIGMPVRKNQTVHLWMFGCIVLVLVQECGMVEKTIFKMKT